MPAKNFLGLLLMGSLIAASCQLGFLQPGPTTPPFPTRGPTAVVSPGPTATLQPVPVAPSPMATLHPSLNNPATPDPIQRAAQDLAARLGVPEQSIAVVLVEDVTWPDPSLGLGKPGESYIQIVVAGQRIHLSHNGVVYEYRSGGGTLKYAGEVSQP